MSIQRIVINQVLRFQVKRRFRKKPDVFELRALMDEMTPLLPAPPTDISVEQMTLGGIPVERLSTPGTNNGAAFFYIHGGGWVAGSPVSQRPLTWRLAKKLGIPVYAVDYRLAPEHFFPAGLDDCIAAYRGLLAQGVPASSIVVGGDSAGGNLTLALALRLKAEGVALPAVLVCLSPATDLTFGGNSVHANAEADSLFVPEMMHTVEARYCPGADRTDPFISPLFGDVAGLPPTLFQVGDTEVLLDDSIRMAEKMKAAGVAVTLDVWPKVWHVWQVMADRLPEGEQAIDKIVAFAKANLKTAGSKAEMSPSKESKPMIKVHHLNNSRSQRILWLLEELELPYEIVKYQRDAVTNLAPPELKTVHPLGKSPVITVDGQVIAESGAIIELLVKKYGKGRLAPAEGTPAYDKYIEWLHFAEGSAMLPLMLALYTGRLGDAAAPLAPRITGEIANHLSYMNNSIEKGGYLLGKEFSAADIQNSFTLEAAKVRGLLNDYPNLLDLVGRLQARPAYKRALEKGGPYAFA